MAMSAARPVPSYLVLLVLSGIALLGFWRGFSESYFGSGGIRNCAVGPAALTGPGGTPIPLATPIAAQPAAPAEVKPADTAKKKADTPKAGDPGTETHDLSPLPNTDGADTPDVTDQTPAPAKTPTRGKAPPAKTPGPKPPAAKPPAAAKPPSEPDPAQQPPY